MIIIGIINLILTIITTITGYILQARKNEVNFLKPIPCKENVHKNKIKVFLINAFFVLTIIFFIMAIILIIPFECKIFSELINIIPTYWWAKILDTKSTGVEDLTVTFIMFLTLLLSFAPLIISLAIFLWFNNLLYSFNNKNENPYNHCFPSFKYKNEQVFITKTLKGTNRVQSSEDLYNGTFELFTNENLNGIKITNKKPVLWNKNK